MFVMESKKKKQREQRQRWKRGDIAGLSSAVLWRLRSTCDANRGKNSWYIYIRSREKKELVESQIHLLKFPIYDI